MEFLKFITIGFDYFILILIPSPAVDWNERRRLLREIAVCGDPAGVPMRLHNRPAESEAFRGNQQRFSPSTLSYSQNNKLYENSLKKQALQMVFLSKISRRRKILQYK
jgi:hypothetical protein